MNSAEIILYAAGSYSALGAVFGTAFVVLGVTKVDHAVAGASWIFRLLIWPGCAALWPIMLTKWVRAGRLKHEEPGT